ncbi:indole-3-glycerol phosphate synthase TrpC [Paenibacillus xylaniclasticus]|uniref:indole-3-glycerol phosphate synthase TrpC n=1 Tax=Paenibacillus xylaniclasticus TaxID=588083 RepID=UPI000FD7709B|nr:MULTISPECIES: indole-3-glycerol phosphate synthase TrpC [Paenibacillus]GFN32268.1 indole-3-glycerol phosphate synthase [Paenibacillus curdlanolyticus]
MFMLNEIIANKHQEIDLKKKNQPVESLKAKVQEARAVRDFYRALSAPGISLIAEIKRKSPSKGEFRTDFDPVALGRIYSRSGARAISVLADEVFFGGGAHIVERVANDNEVHLPVMYKEFIIDPYQIYEARSVGADAVLLIVRCIDKPGMLAQMIELVHELGMNALVECFTEEDAAKAVEAGARIFGINNRDLQTFEVDLKRSEQIRSVLPKDALTVSESGLSSREDALQAEALGFDAMLVGEALLKTPDIERRVREFSGLDAAAPNKA